MALIKNEQEIQILKQGGKILAQVLKQVVLAVKPGIKTKTLDDLAEKLILEKGGRPAFKNYGKPHPFPATLCISVNEQLVHGLPSDYILKNGDIVSLDIGMEYPAKNGLYTDMAVTVPVGKISNEAKKIIKVTKNALKIWIDNVKQGADLYEVAGLVEKHIKKNGFGVIREMVGHGVGHAVHEEPQIPNYKINGASFILKKGMVLAFEPMVSAGDFHLKISSDHWTAVPRDNSLTAHFEHTVVVTERGCEVITR